METIMNSVKTANQQWKESFMTRFLQRLIQNSVECSIDVSSIIWHIEKFLPWKFLQDWPFLEGHELISQFFMRATTKH